MVHVIQNNTSLWVLKGACWVRDAKQGSVGSEGRRCLTFGVTMGLIQINSRLCYVTSLLNKATTLTINDTLKRWKLPSEKHKTSTSLSPESFSYTRSDNTSHNLKCIISLIWQCKINVNYKCTNDQCTVISKNAYLFEPHLKMMCYYHMNIIVLIAWNIESMIKSVILLYTVQ